MLVVFGGLPGVGKTTLAQALAAALRAAYLRIDEIEQALRRAGLPEVGPAGYVAAYALAGSNLRLGLPVVADSVNPLPVTRQAWRDVAAAAGVPVLEVEVVCSDAAEHRRRVEARAGDIPGLMPPRWASVQAHDYAPWTTPRLVLDSAVLTPAAALALLLARMPAPHRAS